METQNQGNQPVQTGSSTTLKVIVLVILIILLVVGIILPIKLVPNAFNTVSDKIKSWFNNNEAIELSLDKNQISSGEEVVLTWNDAPEKDGTYSLTYTCQPGVDVQTSIISPNETIACGGNYFFTTASTSIALKVFSTTTKSVEVPLTLSYLENGSSTVMKLNDINLTVTNGEAPNAIAPSVSPAATSTVEVSPKPTTSPSTSPSVSPKPTTSPKPTPASNSTITRAHRASNPNGKPDLSIRIIATGYMNDNAEFIPSTTVNANVRPAVKFVVTNVGDKNSGGWNFTASLPTPYHPTYSAYNLPNLGPDDSIAYVLGFDGINNARINSVSITADAIMTIGDINRSNNTAQTTITNTSAY